MNDELANLVKTEAEDRVNKVHGMRAETTKEAMSYALSMTKLSKELKETELTEQKQEDSYELEKKKLEIQEAENERKHTLALLELEETKRQNDMNHEIAKQKANTDEFIAHQNAEFQSLSEQNRVLLAKMEAETRKEVSKNETAASILGTIGSVIVAGLGVHATKHSNRFSAKLVDAVLKYCGDPEKPYIDPFSRDFIKSLIKFKR